MSSLFTPDALAPTVTFGQVDVDGLSIAYREAGDASNPKLVLLHGWPSSSHQYRNLIPALADRFHVIAPDYPGFGDSSTPDPASFPYTFDKLAEVTERFLKIKGFDRFGLYVQGLWRARGLPYHHQKSLGPRMAGNSKYKRL